MERAGELRERITIQEQVKERDPTTKQNVGRWVDTCWKRVPASIELQSSRESNRSGQVTYTATYAVRFRRKNVAGLRSDMRIVWHQQCNASLLLNIVAIGFDPKHRKAVLTCQA